ncbi:hypothetical protein F4604DRAFT_61658 [Suillus subluteus]|nr:hypothetical protein F4604DRAFT_61658 [Suillus subluteus]
MLGLRPTPMQQLLWLQLLSRSATMCRLAVMCEMGDSRYELVCVYSKFRHDKQVWADEYIVVSVVLIMTLPAHRLPDASMTALVDPGRMSMLQC